MTSLMTSIRTGVVDLTLPGISVDDPGNDRDAGAGATGILSVIGPFMVDRFADALVATVVKKRTVGFEKVSVDPRYVLAQPWRMRRMINGIAARENNRGIDAIEVNRVCFPELPELFTIINGCHRTYAARAAGAGLIEAEIHEEMTCDPTAFRVEGRVLTRKTRHGYIPVSSTSPWAGEISRAKATLPIDLVMMMLSVGVPGVGEPGSYEFKVERNGLSTRMRAGGEQQ